MAIGTPVVGATAYSAQNGTSVSPAYPSGILATDIVLLFTGQKPSTANGGTATTPSGWTLREELLAEGGYGTTLGADTGNTNLRVYSWDVPVAGQSGNQSVTLATNNISWAFIVRVPTDGGTVSFGSADGSQTATPGTSMSIALTNGATATDFQTGDKAIWAMCIPTDVTTPSQFSAQSVTATGATFATAVELNEPDSSTGNDIGGYSAYAHVDSGSSTTAPTVDVTVAGTRTNVRGPVVLLRLREAAPPPELNAEPDSFTLTGADATTTATRSLEASPASYALTGQPATTAVERLLQADAGVGSLTGSQALLAASRALAGDSGAYSITGVDATLTYTAATLWQVSWAEMEVPSAAVAAVLNAEAGTFSLTGVAATLAVSRELLANSGSYAITGALATLVGARNVNAVAGSYAISGVAASLTQAKNVNAESGSYNVTGVDATLVYTSGLQILSADAGIYSLTGSSASFSKGIVVVASPANYTSAEYVDPGYVDPGYVGNDNPPAALLATRKLNLESGSFSVTGSDATLERLRQLNAEFGLYNITGADARLQYPYWPLPSQVVLGVVYGPNGDDYIGTYVDLSLKIDINTGALIKPLSSKTAITL